MKALRAVFVLLIACCSLFSERARAQYSYYGQEDFQRCRQQLAATGAVAGTANGGLLGYGLGCDEEIRLTSHLFEYANDPMHRFRYYMPYEAQDVRIVQLVSGYDGALPPHFCRLYHVEYMSVDRAPHAFQATMCFINGRWLFPNAAPGLPVIVRTYQTAANPLIRVQVSPVFRPEAPRPSVGPYRFAPPIAQQFSEPEEMRREVRHELQEEHEIRPAVIAPPADRPVLYQRQVQ